MMASDAVPSWVEKGGGWWAATPCAELVEPDVDDGNGSAAL